MHFGLKSLLIVKKNIELHLETQRCLLPLLFAFNHQNFSRYLTTDHVELKNLPSKNPSTYKGLQTYGIGATISIPGDLVTEVTINREVKVRGGPMRGAYSTSFNAENGFVLKSLILTELRKELKSKMRLKTASKHKEATYGEMQRLKEQTQSLLKILKTNFSPFHGAARNMATGTEVLVSIANGLLSARENGEECLKEFKERRLASCEKSVL